MREMRERSVPRELAVHEGTRRSRGRRSRFVLLVAAVLTAGFASACSGGGGGGGGAAPPAQGQGNWDTALWDQFDWA